jgi:hypothetical protein
MNMQPKQIAIYTLAGLALVVGGNLAYRIYLTRSAQPAAAIVTDQDLQQEVERKLSASELFRGEKVSVNVTNGVVTLSGTVREDWKRISAGNIASSVAGVSAVKNGLQLREVLQPSQGVWKSGNRATAGGAPEMAPAKRARRTYVDPVARARELVDEGNYYISQKNHAAAVKAFREALALDGSNYAAQSGLQEAQRMR